MALQVKYVGAKPRVSQHGVTFDSTKPDSYLLLAPALELLETLESRPDSGEARIHTLHDKAYTPREIEEALHRYCEDIDALLASAREKTDALIAEYRDKVAQNGNLTADERTAWLGNIDIMRDYYLQYILNEETYRCLLEKIAALLHRERIRYLLFPLGRNLGLVADDLVRLLTDSKPPYDAMIRIVERDDERFGMLDLNRPEPLDI